MFQDTKGGRGLVTRRKAAPGADYIRSSGLVGFSEVVAEQGARAEYFIGKAGLPLTVLSDLDGVVSWSAVGTLMELTALELQRPVFGLEWALKIPPYFPNAGPYLVLAYKTDTLRDWIAAIAGYTRFHTNAYSLQLVDTADADTALLRFQMRSRVVCSRHQVEYVLANICRIARSIPPFSHHPVSAVRFQHGRPADVSIHTNAFRCGIEFEAAHDEIVFDRALLDQHVGRDIDTLRGGLDRHIRYRIHHMRAYDQTMATMVAAVIHSVMGSGWCTNDFIATTLNVSPKKLRRLLAVEGTSFSDVLDDVRRTMAMKLLRESGMPISAIAGLLEYSSIAPFTLAFKRWSGVSPRAFRQGAAALPAVPPG